MVRRYGMVKGPSLLGLIAPTVVFLWLAHLFASQGNWSFVPAWLWLAFALPLLRVARLFEPAFPLLRLVRRLFGLGTFALFLYAMAGQGWFR